MLIVRVSGTLIVECKAVPFNRINVGIMESGLVLIRAGCFKRAWVPNTAHSLLSGFFSSCKLSHTQSQCNVMHSDLMEPRGPAVELTVCWFCAFVAPELCQILSLRVFVTTSEKWIRATIVLKWILVVNLKKGKHNIHTRNGLDLASRECLLFIICCYRSRHLTQSALAPKWTSSLYFQ